MAEHVGMGFDDVVRSLALKDGARVLDAVGAEFIMKPRGADGRIVDIGSWIRGWESSTVVRVEAIAIDKNSDYLVRVVGDGDSTGFWASLAPDTVVVGDPKRELLVEFADAYGEAGDDAERVEVLDRYIKKIKGVR